LLLLAATGRSDSIEVENIDMFCQSNMLQPIASRPQHEAAVWWMFCIQKIVGDL